MKKVLSAKTATQWRKQPEKRGSGRPRRGRNFWKRLSFRDWGDAKHAKALCPPGRLLPAADSGGPKLLWAGLPFRLAGSTCPRPGPCHPARGTKPWGNPPPRTRHGSAQSSSTGRKLRVSRSRAAGSAVALPCGAAPCDPPGSQSRGSAQNTERGLNGLRTQTPPQTSLRKPLLGVGEGQLQRGLGARRDSRGLGCTLF